MPRRFEKPPDQPPLPHAVFPSAPKPVIARPCGEPSELRNETETPCFAAHMPADHLILITLAIGVVAFLYSSVGHAGASGYIAVMSLASFAPSTIRPVALVLNILVACLSTWQFWRAGHFSWRLYWPFGLISIPFAFLGGYIRLPNHILQWLLGVVLLFSAFRFFTKQYSEADVKEPSKPLAMTAGAGLGLLSGLTGTGGGIFLTPLLILMKWARTKPAAAVSALFILVNSISGLAGNLSATRSLPSITGAFVVAALIGGSIGSYLGSHRMPHGAIKKMLACVLTIAGAKLLLT
jgi:uncharacterized protein